MPHPPADLLPASSTALCPQPLSRPSLSSLLSPSLPLMPLPPIVSSCLLALAIGCASNIIAQKLKAYNSGDPFVFDRTLFVQFAVVAVITTPVNYYWQNWLERTFPGWKLVKQKREASSGDAEKGAFLRDDGEDKRAIEEEVRVRDWWNIFRKWFTDCITMGALLNTTMFLVLMGLMEGKTITQIGNDLTNVRNLHPRYGSRLSRSTLMLDRKCGRLSGTLTRCGPLPTSSAPPIAPSSAASSSSASAACCGTST